MKPAHSISMSDRHLRPSTIASATSQLHSSRPGPPASGPLPSFVQPPSPSACENELAANWFLSFRCAEVEADFRLLHFRRTRGTFRLLLVIEILLYLGTGVFLVRVPRDSDSDSDRGASRRVGAGEGGFDPLPVYVIHFYISIPIRLCFLLMSFSSFLLPYRGALSFFWWGSEIACSVVFTVLVPDEIGQLHVGILVMGCLLYTNAMGLRWHYGAVLALVGWAAHVIVHMAVLTNYMTYGSLNYVPGYLLLLAAVLVGSRIAYTHELLARNFYLLERFASEGLRVPLLGKPIQVLSLLDSESWRADRLSRASITPSSKFRVPTRKDSLKTPRSVAEDLGSEQAMIEKPLAVLVLDVNLIPDEEESFKRLDFDVFSVPVSRLAAHVVRMFDIAGLTERFKISRDTLVCFVSRIALSYNAVPYHNVLHAFDVTQTVFFMYTQSRETLCQYLTPLDILALFVSALCHDVDHPGLNNAYQIKTRSRLAMLYNDQSVLENHHCSESFAVLSRPETNIFANLSTAEYLEVRRTIVVTILGTDMGRHFDIVSRFRSRIAAFETAQTGSAPTLKAAVLEDQSRSQEPEDTSRSRSRIWDRDSPDDRRLLMEVVLKCADISNVMKPCHISKRWGDLLQDECFQQGDKERELGLPVSPIFERKDANQAQSQLSFMKTFATPLFESITAVLPELKICSQALQENIDVWQEVMTHGNAALIKALAASARKSRPNPNLSSGIVVPQQQSSPFPGQAVL